MSSRELRLWQQTVSCSIRWGACCSFAEGMNPARENLIAQQHCEDGETVKSACRREVREEDRMGAPRSPSSGSTSISIATLEAICSVAFMTELANKNSATSWGRRDEHQIGQYARR